MNIFLSRKSGHIFVVLASIGIAEFGESSLWFTAGIHDWEFQQRDSTFTALSLFWICSSGISQPNWIYLSPMSSYAIFSEATKLIIISWVGPTLCGLNFDLMYPKQKQARQDFKIRCAFKMWKSYQSRRYYLYLKQKQACQDFRIRTEFQKCGKFTRAENIICILNRNKRDRISKKDIKFKKCKIYRGRKYYLSVAKCSQVHLSKSRESEHEMLNPKRAKLEMFWERKR